MISRVLLGVFVFACAPTSVPAPAPAPAPERNPPLEITFTPEPQPIPDAAVLAAFAAAEPIPPRCSALDLNAWRTQLEHAAAQDRVALLGHIGLVIVDEDDYELDFDELPAHPPLYLREVRIHELELGGPPGLEKVVEVELAGNEKLDETHAHAAVQVFTQTPNGELCRVLEHGELSAFFAGENRRPPHAEAQLRWGPQSIDFVELLAAGINAIEVHWVGGQPKWIEEWYHSISYWALDERGQLVQIFGPHWLFYRRVNPDSEVQIVEVRGEVRVLDSQWPAELETNEEFARQIVDEPRAERGSQRRTWRLRDGVYEARRAARVDGARTEE